MVDIPYLKGVSSFLKSVYFPEMKTNAGRKCEWKDLWKMAGWRFKANVKNNTEKKKKSRNDSLMFDLV